MPEPLPGILFVLAYVLAIVGGLTVLVAAFRVSLLWGLAMLFLPGIVHLLFIIVHWKEAKTGVFLQFGALAVFLLTGVYG